MALRSTPSFVMLLSMVALLGSCAIAWQRPRNSVDMQGDGAYMAERRDMPAMIGSNTDATKENRGRCDRSVDLPDQNPSFSGFLDGAALSPGDLVRVVTASGEAPDGTYKVSSNGALLLPAVGQVQVAGMPASDAATFIAQQLIQRGQFKKGHAHVSLLVLDRGEIRVVVSGAVFQPGHLTINVRSSGNVDTLRESASGDHALGRALSNALANAAGLRPDADVRRIVVERGSARMAVDLSGFFTGEKVNDVLLVDGDIIEVPSRHCFQLLLTRPSPVTPPGIRIAVSNLVSPAINNAGAAIGTDARNVPYGTRFLQALVGANCVGGTQVTNADRWAVLMSQNLNTGHSEVVERRVEALVRRPDRDDYNPVLMPNDAIACYDSNVTNVRDVVRTISEGLLSGFVGTRL